MLGASYDSRRQSRSGIPALDPRRWWALALLCGAFFMVVLDASIVIVALPSIEADLGLSEQGLQWVVSAYAVTFAGLLLLGGRAADLLGRRRVLMVGVVLFTAASPLCGGVEPHTPVAGPASEPRVRSRAAGRATPRPARPEPASRPWLPAGAVTGVGGLVCPGLPGRCGVAEQRGGD